MSDLPRPVSEPPAADSLSVSDKDNTRVNLICVNPVAFIHPVTRWHILNKNPKATIILHVVSEICSGNEIVIPYAALARRCRPKSR